MATNYLKKMTIIIGTAVTLVITFTNCKSFKEGREYFKYPKLTTSAVLQIDLTIRNVDVIPDNVYIMNMSTCKMYKMEYDSGKMFIIRNIPLGEYQIAFFSATYNVNKINFKMFTYTKYRVILNEYINYDLGYLTYNTEVNSTVVKPLFVHIDKISSKFPNAQTVFSEEITIEEYKYPLYKEFDYGYVKYVNSGDNLEYEEWFEEAAEIKKDWLKKIENEMYSVYSDGGIADALKYIDEMISKTGEINFSVFKAELLIKNGDNSKAVLIYEDIYRRDPNNIHYFKYMGDHCYFQGTKDNALNYYYKTISYGLIDENVFINYINILLEKEKTEAALITVDYALFYYPKSEKLRKTASILHKKEDNINILE